MFTRIMDLDNKIRIELGKNKKQVITDELVLHQINGVIKDYIQ